MTRDTEITGMAQAMDSDRKMPKLCQCVKKPVANFQVWPAPPQARNLQTPGDMSVK